MTKNLEKHLRIFYIFFDEKWEFTYLPLGLHKGRPSNWRSLQPSKKKSSFPKIKCINFFLLFWAIFALLDPVSDPQPKHFFANFVVVVEKKIIFDTGLSIFPLPALGTSEKNMKG